MKSRIISFGDPDHHLRRSSINHDDIVGAIGARPYSAGKEYDEFISNKSPIKSAKGGNNTGDVVEEEEESGGAGMPLPGLAFVGGAPDQFLGDAGTRWLFAPETKVSF